jgi:hypothetical protein
MREIINPSFDCKLEEEGLFFNNIKDEELIDKEILDLYNNGFVRFLLYRC